MVRPKNNGNDAHREKYSNVNQEKFNELRKEASNRKYWLRLEMKINIPIFSHILLRIRKKCA